VLGHDLIELAGFQLLGQGAQAEAQHGHGGAKAQSLLQGTGRLHFVVAQADPEATGIAVAGRAGATAALFLAG
jgi:hypothetical protein